MKRILYLFASVACTLAGCTVEPAESPLSGSDAPVFKAYYSEDGQTRTVTGDAVVACGGMAPLQTEAVAFDRAADRFFAVGDCSRVGNIHTCTRSAFSAAAQI